ncbi:hypothetical protein HPP92_005299 [Vanilla planifolia]|uniref:30S ribosomal protein S9 n=1 Tax=Vanilla planifolia TaxID=51239 RepID=A0A835RN57_VANPL|nr:hypothetical protein HPP92_005592 [Vanilla planifolia]KAG0494305.1 hypothetical protein HPP92_005299 [Vanilla planifolia]
MLARLFYRPLHLRFIPITLALAKPTFSPSLFQFHSPSPTSPQSLAPDTWSILHHCRPWSSNRGDGRGKDDETWKFTEEGDESSSIFGEEERDLSGFADGPEEAFESPEVAAATAGSVTKHWDDSAAVGGKKDIFEDIDREMVSKKGDEEDEWKTAEGYKPWSLGEDEGREDVFNIEDETGAIEGIEGDMIDELDKEASEEQEKLQKREQELLDTLKGPDRAFGDLIAASGITDDMIDSLILLKDVRGIKGLPPLSEIEDKAIAKLNATSSRAEVERKKQEEIAKARVRQVDEKGRAYGTGRRKCSIARVWVKPGDGKFIVNDKQFDTYFPILDHRADLLRPFTVTNTLGLWDVSCTVKGGGVSGQVGAIRLGISRALQNWEPGLRTYLKAAGFLTRDPRWSKRKKPGKSKEKRASSG